MNLSIKKMFHLLTTVNETKKKFKNRIYKKVAGMVLEEYQLLPFHNMTTSSSLNNPITQAHHLLQVIQFSPNRSICKTKCYHQSFKMNLHFYHLSC